MNRICFVILLSTLFFNNIIAQKQAQWLNIGEKSTNFDEIKTAFLDGNAELLKEYYQDLDNLSKGKIQELPKGKYSQIKQFMRLLDWYEPRVAETQGDMRLIGEATYRAQLQAKKAVQTRGAQWKILGPINQSSLLSGNGRINSIRVDPTNPDVLYACSPASQLFKSENGGISWRSITDNLLGIGITDVAIDSTAPNTLYAITGDADRAIYHPYSTGMYKSTDGGATWNTTGLNFSQSNSINLTSIIIHPKNPNIILVGSTNGIYRSVDAGNTFTRTLTSGSIRELVFKPHDPNVIFAGSKTGGQLLRSTDNGVTWTRLTNGLPTTDVVRYSITISPTYPDLIYTLATNTANGMRGFYRSTDGGSSFSLMSTTPNIPGTQGWYDLAIAVHPTDSNIVFAGGISLYRSTNSGTTWTTTGSGTVHVDHHCLTFSGTTLLNANDGGVYKTTNNGTNWTNISSNLSIAQMYGIGQSMQEENLIISGHQDNGTNLTLDNQAWRQVSGGDGMIAFIDPSNDSLMYCTFQNGVLRRSTNRGQSFSTIYTVPSGNWVTPYIPDAHLTTTLYTAGRQVLRSVNRGTTWDSISNFTGLSFRWLEVDRNDPKIIYALASNRLLKTIDGGVNWQNISTGLPTTSLQHVHIDVNNSNNIYVSVGSYQGRSLYFSQDGGTTWVNYSGGLPNVPTNCIVTQLGAKGEVYCGTDIGVYYRDSSATEWKAYQTGMPSVPVRDLEIFYPTGKIRAGTFGRSIWESPLNYFKKECTATVTPSVSNINLSNATVAWASALGAVRYKLEYKEADSTNWLSINNIKGTYITLAGLTVNKTYNVRVSSVCAESEVSAPSTVRNFRPVCPAPNTPSVSDIKTTEADVTWAMISGIPSNTLEYKKADSTNWISIKNIDVPGYNLTNLSAGTRYNVRLSSNCTVSIGSDPTNIVNFTTLCPAPSITLSRILDTTVTISWAAIVGISSYTLEYKKADSTNWISIKNIDSSRFILKGLTPNTRYDVRVLTPCPSIVGTSSSERFLTGMPTPILHTNLTNKFSLKLYPNPATHILNMDIETPESGQFDIEITNVLGNRIFNQKAILKEGKNSLQLSTQYFTEGFYFVKLGLGQAFTVKKIVVKKE